ncbi:MAG: YbjN domain-containing protein [Hyphomicrobiaceae bacterium]|nr:YbjN domain-containing protein [Hyphomicrobiaceae bacterium]
MSLIDFDLGPERDIHPVDVIEQVAALNEWAFDRSNEHEITISVEGSFADYHVSFSWMVDVEALHLASGFDLKVPVARRTEVVKLLARINEHMLVGHFDLWHDDGIVLYRASLLLSGGAEPTPHQCAELLANAIENCERYYQAFQFVVWAGKTAEEALSATLFETAGEA